LLSTELITVDQKVDCCRYCKCVSIQHYVAALLVRIKIHIIQGGPAKVRPTLLVTFECVGKIQWFLAIWWTIL